MATLRIVSLLALWSTLALADTERDLQWRTAAAQQLAARLRTEWQSVVDAETSFGWRIALPNGQTFAGDWVLRHPNGWTYLFDGTELRCRMQPASQPAVACGSGESFGEHEARIVIEPTTRPRSLASLQRLYRALAGTHDYFAHPTVRGDANGNAVVETIVTQVTSSPLETRWKAQTSRRYRVPVTLTTSGFTVGEPALVEQYREACDGTMGCHDVYWNCRRVN